MGNEEETPTRGQADDAATEDERDGEERGFAADLRRFRDGLAALLADRGPEQRGLRSQGAVGLVARADATLPSRRVNRPDEEDTEGDITEEQSG